VSAAEPLVPRYGEVSLSDLVPSVLAALGLPGFANRLGIEPLPGVCVLVVDGLGWELLRDYRDTGPFLATASDRGRPITAGFPSTTSASLASLGTGLPPGQHGLVGYTFAVPGLDRPINSLHWVPYGFGPTEDLRDRLVPEQLQPEPTVLERAAAAGTEITLVGPAAHAGSGLTRAILRGGRYAPADSLDELVQAVAAAFAEGRTSVYAYHPFLDTYGHVRGVGSEEWLGHLQQVDDAVSALADRLPPGFALVVTADHGMLNIPEGGKLDVADAPALLEGVRMLGGEARARHVYAWPGAEVDVLAAWRETVGDRMWVCTGDEAIAAGWFGPKVLDRVRPRIGDVVAAAHEPIGVFQREVDPLQASLIGHHGSLTQVEQLVPFLLIRPEG
jgi:hypothetical protein